MCENLIKNPHTPQDQPANRLWHQAQGQTQTVREANYESLGRSQTLSHLSLQTQRGLKQKRICKNKDSLLNIHILH